MAEISTFVHHHFRHFNGAALVDAACAITPGLESPTVSNLQNRDWCAVRAMVPRSGTNAVMDELYDLGARAILVTDITACRL